MEVPRSCTDTVSVESVSRVDREADGAVGVDAKESDENSAESPVSVKLSPDVNVTVSDPDLCVESIPTPPVELVEQASAVDCGPTQSREKESVKTANVDSGEAKSAELGNGEEMVHVELQNATQDDEQSDDISDWDGESVDSAVIDARLLSRIKSVEESTP